MWATVVCEDPTLALDQQSNVKDPTGPNGRENSWGLTQIDLDFNPGVTKYDAEDPYFALSRMADLFSTGHADRYHCYKKLFPNK